MRKTGQLYYTCTCISAKQKNLIKVCVLLCLLTNTKVKYAALHNGVNAVRDNCERSDIYDSIVACLNKMHEVFPNACIAFSEILFMCQILPK